MLLLVVLNEYELRELDLTDLCLVPTCAWCVAFAAPHQSDGTNASAIVLGMCCCMQHGQL